MEIFCGFNDNKIEFTPNSITLRDVYIDRGNTFNPNTNSNKYFKITLFSYPFNNGSQTNLSKPVQYDLVKFTGDISIGIISNGGLLRTVSYRTNYDLQESKIGNFYYTKFTFEYNDYYYRGTIKSLVNLTEGTYVDITPRLYVKNGTNLVLYTGSKKLGVFKRLPLIKYKFKDSQITTQEGKFNGHINESNKKLPEILQYRDNFYFDYITFNFGQENFWKYHSGFTSTAPIFIGLLFSDTTSAFTDDGITNYFDYLNKKDSTKEFALQEIFSYREFIHRSIKQLKNNYYLNNIIANIVSQTSSKTTARFAQYFNVTSLQGLPYTYIPYAIYSKDVNLTDYKNTDSNSNLKQDGHRLFTEISSNRYDLVKRSYTPYTRTVSFDNIDKNVLEYQAKYDLSEPILVEASRSISTTTVTVDLTNRLSSRFLTVVDGFTLDENKLIEGGSNLNTTNYYLDKSVIPNEELKKKYDDSEITKIGNYRFITETTLNKNTNDYIPVDNNNYGPILSINGEAANYLCSLYGKPIEDANGNIIGRELWTKDEIDQEMSAIKINNVEGVNNKFSIKRPIVYDTYGKEHTITSIKGLMYNSTGALQRYITLKPYALLEEKDYTKYPTYYNSYNADKLILFTGTTQDLNDNTLQIHVIRQFADLINQRIETAYDGVTKSTFAIQIYGYDEYLSASNTYVKPYTIPNTSESDYLYVSDTLKLDMPLFKYPKGVFSIGNVTYNDIYNCLFTEVSSSGANEYSNIDSGTVYIKPSINGYYYENGKKVESNILSLTLPDTMYNGNIQFLFSETTQKLKIDTSKDTIIQLARPFYDNASYDINFDILNIDNKTLIERFTKRCNIDKLDYSDYAAQLSNNFTFDEYIDPYTDVFGVGLWDNKKQFLLTIKNIDQFKFYTNTPRYCKVTAYSGNTENTEKILEVQRKEFVINEKVAIDNNIEIYFEMACFSQDIPNFTVSIIISDEIDNADKTIWSKPINIKTPTIDNASEEGLKNPTSLCHFNELLTNTWNFTNYSNSEFSGLTLNNVYNQKYVNITEQEHKRLIKYSDFNNVNKETNKNYQSKHYYLTEKTDKTTVEKFNEFKGYITLISRYDMYYDYNTAIRQCDICVFNIKERPIPNYNPKYENVITTIDYITGITDGKDYTLVNNNGGVYELSGYKMSQKILIGSPNTCEYSSKEGKNVLTPNLGKVIVNGYISFNLISDNLIDLNDNSILNIKKGCIIEINYYDRCNNRLNNDGDIRFELPSIDTISSSMVSILDTNEYPLLRHTKYVEINVIPLILAETKYDYFIENLRIEVTKSPTIQIYNTAIDIDYDDYTYYHLPGVGYNYYTYNEANETFINKSNLLLKSKYKEINELPYYNDALTGNTIVIVDNEGLIQKEYTTKQLTSLIEKFYNIK